MRIFFDVDYTILSIDEKLRSGTHHTWERLIADGHEVHVWSGIGKRHMTLKHHGLAHLVTGVYEKPIFDYVRRLPELGVDCMPDFVIDDYPQIVEVFGGYLVREFYLASDDDDEMEQIYEAIAEFAKTGSASNRRWRRRHPNFESMR